MKANRTISISVLLNLVLMGLIAFLLNMRPHYPESAANSSPKAIAATLAARSSLPRRSATSAHPETNSVPFDWRQVESEDYKQYIANLRAIGCPEKTIKEIILADVNDLFAARRATITRTNHYEYWRSNPVNLSDDQQKQLSELHSEKAETLKALGVESPDMANLLGDYFRSHIEARELELDFLSATKRQQITELRNQQIQQMVVAGEDSTKAAEIEQQTESAIKSLLTTEELYDYELRTSVPAAQLRAAMNYLEPTEQEFRTIYDNWTGLRAKQGSAEYREIQQSSEASLQLLLGSNRFQVYLQGVKTLGYTR